MINFKNLKDELQKQLVYIMELTYKDGTKEYIPLTKYIELICEIYSCYRLRNILLSYGVNMSNIIDVEISYCCDVLEGIKQNNSSFVEVSIKELIELLDKNRTKTSNLPNLIEYELVLGIK